MSQRGKFIVFEGIDGSGKSTIIEEVRQHLRMKGVAAEFVYDPGGTEIGGKIRKILLDKKNMEMTPMTELLLYCASRSQLIDQVIRPALDAGKHVVSDRFIYSTLAYQGVSGQVKEDILRNAVNLACGGLFPDHIFYLDIPAEDGLRRAGGSPDRMESKGVCFMEEVRQRYLGMMDALDELRATVVDATNPLLEVKAEVLKLIDYQL